MQVVAKRSLVNEIGFFGGITIEVEEDLGDIGAVALIFEGVLFDHAVGAAELANGFVAPGAGIAAHELDKAAAVGWTFGHSEVRELAEGCEEIAEFDVLIDMTAVEFFRVTDE